VEIQLFALDRYQ